MALNMSFGSDDNEYVGMAEKARKEAGPLGGLLQGIGEALGLSKPVAKPPKESETAEPTPEAAPAPVPALPVRDSRGDVVSAIEAAAGPTVQPIALPGSMIEIDPDTGLPIIKTLGQRPLR
jgi:hypothetical protein